MLKLNTQRYMSLLFWMIVLTSHECIFFEAKLNQSSTVIWTLNYRFKIDLKKDWDRSVLESVHKCARLSEINEINLSCVNPSNSNVKMFLSSVAPKKLKSFYFWGKDYEDKAVSSDYYLEELKGVCKAATEKVCFKNCRYLLSKFYERFLNP